MVSQLSKFSVLFLFISLSSGLNSERSYFDKYSGFPSNNAPYYPPKTNPYFPPPSDWDMFRNFQMLEMLSERRTMLNQLMDMKSEFQQFMQMKNSGLLPSFPSSSSSSFPTPPSFPDVPVMNTYLGDSWRPEPMEKPAARLEVRNGKLPIVVQMFEIPRKMAENVQNCTRIESSAVPEVLGVKCNGPVVADPKSGSRVFVERITKPEVSTYKYEMDLPKEP